jgi:SAM-dependent methyltransferase
VPVYPRLGSLDTLDFTERTIRTGAGLHAAIEPRRRLIAEAGRLEAIPEGAYDALLASHVLEHLANPLGALREWRRILRPGGHVLLIVPHREGTFDHRRPVTTLEHLREDAERRTGEDDMTHLEEILELHDLSRDPGAPSREVFERRCRENLTTRGMHHHVFLSRTVAELCLEAGLEVLLLRPTRPFNIVCLCRVPSVDGAADRVTVGEGGEPRGGLDRAELARALRASPFLSDRPDAVPVGSGA